MLFKNKLFISFSWILFEKIIRILTGFLLSVIMARTWGAENFGVAHYSMAMVSIFAVLSTLGINDILLHDFSKNIGAHKSEIIRSTAFSLRLIISIFLYFLFIVFIYFISSDLSVFYFSTIYSIYLILTSSDVFEMKFKSEKRYNFISRIKIFALFVGFLFKLIGLLFNYSIYFYASSLLIEYLILLILFFLCSRPFKFILDFTYFFNLIRRSWLILLSYLLFMVQLRVEFVIIEKFLTKDDIGQFSLAFRLIELFDIITIILLNFILPTYSNNYFENKLQNSRKIYLVTFVSFILILPCIFLSYFLFPFLYGKNFMEGINLFALLFLRPLFISLYTMRGLILIMENKYKLSVIFSIIGVFSSYFFASLAIPLLGIYGSFISIYGSLFLSTILADVIFNRFNFFSMITCWKEYKILLTLKS